MIESIKIKNFQSHISTKLVLDPGVNSIVGSSDSGKTAIMRALFWDILNRPSGTSFVSHWALDKKGKQVQPTFVSVTINGKKVKRTRTAEENSYAVDGKLLEAVRTDVPPDVEQAFNLSEVNIQRQMDSPFLLSQSAGEVARFFNRIIRLDIIDSFLASVNSKKRKTKADLLEAGESVEKLEKDLEELDWIDRAEKLLLKAERVEIKADQTFQARDKLDDLISQYIVYQADINALPNLDKVDELIEKYLKVEDLASRKSIVINDLEYQLEKWNESSDLIKKDLPDFEKTQTLMDELSTAKEKAEIIKDDIHDINDSIHRWGILKKQTASAADGITRLEKQLPELCPTCGNLLKGNKK